MKIDPSSRFIIKINQICYNKTFYNDSYKNLQYKGLPQKQLSKEFVRQWLIEKNFQ